MVEARWRERCVQTCDEKGDPDLDVDAGLSAKGPEVIQMFVNALALKK